MTHNNCIKVWHGIPTLRLKQPCIPNFDITSTLGIALFWEEVQNIINEHCRNFHARDCNIRDKLIITVDDNKHRLNSKMPADNL